MNEKFKGVNIGENKIKWTTDKHYDDFIVNLQNPIINDISDYEIEDIIAHKNDNIPPTYEVDKQISDIYKEIFGIDHYRDNSVRINEFNLQNTVETLYNYKKFFNTNLFKLLSYLHELLFPNMIKYDNPSQLVPIQSIIMKKLGNGVDNNYTRYKLYIEFTPSLVSYNENDILERNAIWQWLVYIINTVNNCGFLQVYDDDIKEKFYKTVDFNYNDNLICEKRIYDNDGDRYFKSDLFKYAYEGILNCVCSYLNKLFVTYITENSDKIMNENVLDIVRIDASNENVNIYGNYKLILYINFKIESMNSLL